MKFERFEGIIPALLTPYDKNDEVNYAAMRKLVDCLIKEGVGGLFPCGSTGEWFYLTADERMKIAETVVEAAAGRTKVMVHVGALSTRQAQQLARHAEKAGASAISALPPIGLNYNAEAIWNHFRAIGESANLPFYLYHLPQVYGDMITMDKFVEALDKIPTLAGAKFSSYRIDDMMTLRLKAKGRLNIISGCAEQLLSAIACGAEGSICTWYNFVPRLGNEIIKCVKSNRVEDARRLEETMIAYGAIAGSRAVANVKWLVAHRGLDVGRPRLPLPAVTPEEQKALLPKIEATGIMEWALRL